jgi:hypothetical protein
VTRPPFCATASSFAISRAAGEVWPHSILEVSIFDFSIPIFSPSQEVMDSANLLALSKPLPLSSFQGIDNPRYPLLFSRPLFNSSLELLEHPFDRNDVVKVCGAGAFASPCPFVSLYRLYPGLGMFLLKEAKALEQRSLTQL